MQTLNISLQTQINSNQAQLSSLASLFTSLKSEMISNNTQLNSQIQNIITVANSQKLITDSIREDLTSSTNSLQAQINNINAVNNAQDAEITLIKNQLASSAEYIAVQNCISSGQGYCTTVKQCCLVQLINTFSVVFACQGSGTISSSQCGTYKHE
ncbi:Hypothetical_protein [Hexamita inflata]|uniref:Hypothetical_protein n=1 Tax=Hexamita inflata TaxID=28002 RepID=A0AA86UC90_9EUKA|nr:Hypothetical protein HINF_LOCUS37589 [Hexamita inflata]